MRQLAAILFADMVGYTALMQENEQVAQQKRKRFKEILENSIAEFYGKILQYYGDEQCGLELLNKSANLKNSGRVLFYENYLSH